jgi:hypothetical protein
MASIVKMWTNPSSSSPRYVNLELNPTVTLRPSRNLHGTEFWNVEFQDKGELIEELKPGQKFTAIIGHAECLDYNGLFQPNHRLYQLCSSVQALTVLEPNEPSLLTISGTARIAFRPADIGYAARLYIVD